VSVYLSVDLDYWCEHENQKSATNFFKRVMDLRVPVTFVIEHEELLNDINRMENLTRIYNVDYHSDIIAQHDKENTPQDYEWANHVGNSIKADYTWIMPHVRCYSENLGLCHGNEDDNPFLKNTNSGWRSCSRKTGLRHVKLKNVDRVGVCLSPCFVTLYPVEKVLEMLGVEYEKTKQLVQDQPWSVKKRKRGVLTEIAA
jgi:hypothetical protein